MRTRPWLLLLTMAVVAGAPLPGAGEVSCKEAIDTLCPDSSPGTPERRQCVRDGVEKLPERCRARLREARSSLTAGMEALRSSCRAEIDGHCDDVQRGGGRLLRCLRALDEEKLGDTCSGYLDTLAKIRAAREEKRGEGEKSEPEPPTE